MDERARTREHTFAEYVAQEERSEIKHDLMDGEIRAMAPVAPERGRLAARVIRLLGNALEGKPCEVFSSDVRLRVRETGLATYPDASVVCGRLEIDPENRNTMTNPSVLVEVLSDSTESYDRTTKLAHYRRIASLRDYLLVAQHEARIEHYRRNDDGTWTLRDVIAPDVVRLSIGVDLSVAEVYRSALPA